MTNTAHIAPSGPVHSPHDQGWPHAADGSNSDNAARGRLRQHLRGELAAKLPGRIDTASHTGDAAVVSTTQRAAAHEILEQAVRAHSEAELMANHRLLGPDVEQQVVVEVLNELFGMAGLQPLLDDPAIETINVNGHDRVFVQYTGGRRAHLGPVAASDDELIDLVRTLAARSSAEERRFDRASPAVNLQLPGGERLFAVMGLTAGGRPALSIRRHGFRTVTLADLADMGTVDVGLRAFLALAGPGAPQHPDHRRGRHREDHDAARAGERDRPDGADRHHRGRVRTRPGP